MSLIYRNLLTVATVSFFVLLSLSSISFAAPDLIVLSVDAPSFTDTGGTISVPVTFKNQGTDLTNGSYVVCRLIVSPDTAINLGDIYYTEKNILNTELQEGESASTTFTYTLPLNLQGSYYVGAYVDSTPSPTYHTESNESNNANYDPTPLYIGSLPAPTLLNPTLGEDLIGAPYTFSWSVVSGASFYQLKISTQSDFATTVVNNDQILGSATSYTYPGSLPWGTTHYWQMRSLNSSGTEWGDWSAVQSFVPVQGSTLELLTPASGGTVNNAIIDFDWSDIDNIDHYEIIVDNNPGLGSPEIHVETLSTSEYEVKNWLSDNTYYWKVITHLNDGTTLESSTESFHYTLPLWEKPVLVPLYRFYNGSTHDHFYTTSESEKANLIAGSDYTFEKIESYLSDRKFDNSACGYLFRLYNPALDVHYYTSNEVERDNKIIDGYSYEGIVGFLYAIPGENVVPFQHMEHTTNTDNLYTISKFEAVNSTSLGFVPRGIVGYVSPDGLKEPMVHSRPQANFGGVDLASGAYRGLNSLDLKMKGRGPDLSFSHYYNSFGFNQIPMGTGWNHNLCAYITEGIDDSVIVHWGNGTTSRFELEDGNYVDKTGNHDRLNLVDDGSNYGFDLTKKNQTIYEFRRFRAYPFIDLNPENLEVIVLLHVKDWAGNQLTFDYQAETTISDDFGRSLVLSYNTNRQLERVTEKASGITKRTISFNYNANDLLATYTDADGGITRYAYYDEPATLRHNLLKSITYPKNNTVEIDYDQATGQVISIKDENGLDPSGITYTPTTGLTTVTDPLGHIFKSDHNADGRLARFTNKPNADFNTDADWNVIERTDTDNPNLPTKITDKRGNSTEYDYDLRGNLLWIKNADNMEANFTYKLTNKLESSIAFHDPKQVVPPATVYTYDQNDNRLRTITNPEGETVTIVYDNTDLDLVTTITDARGPAYKNDFTYDSYGNLETVTDAEGNLTQYENDYAGRTTAVIDAKGIKTTHTYDNKDHPLALSNYRLDGVNILRTINRLYDDNGNLETVRWINQGTLSQTQYTYDDRDRLETVVKPGGLTQTLSYYDNDLLHTRQDYNNQTTTYVYDDRNRLHETQYPDGSKVIIARNENGQPTNVTLDKTSGTDLMSVFNYDELSRMERYTDPYGKNVFYTYDEAGRLKQLTYPNGNNVDYTYDDAGRMKTVTDWNQGVVSYNYDAAGNLKEITRSVDNGVTTLSKTVYTYDLASRLTGIEEKDASDATLWSYTYNLDEVGNHNSVDAMNEPLTFTPVAQNVIYSNDRTNNRLLSAGATTYTYDNNGNRATAVTGGVTTTYSWDYENRLTSVSAPSSTNVQHIYDGMGNRIARVEDGSETRYVLDLNSDMSRVLAETDAAGNVTAYYVYGYGLVSRIESTNDRYFYHFNNRGDTVALSDDSGAITDRYAYDEYGKLMASTGTTTNPFKFVGRFGVMGEGDDDYFMRARFYDAEVGKFLSEDPLGFGGGDWNLTAYAIGGPVKNIDPAGLSWFSPDSTLYKMTSWADNEKLVKTAKVAGLFFRGAAVVGSLTVAPWAAPFLIAIDNAPIVYGMFNGTTTAKESGVAALTNLATFGFMKWDAAIAQNAKGIDFLHGAKWLDNQQFNKDALEYSWETSNWLYEMGKTVYEVGND